MFPINFTDDPKVLWSIILIIGISCAAVTIKNKKGFFKNSGLYSLRILLLLLLTGALCKPYIEQPGNQALIPIYTDISDSLDESLAQQALARAVDMHSVNSVSRVVPFADDTQEISLRMQNPRYTKLKDDNNRLNIGRSNLEAALKHALQNNEKQVLLVSDGYETSGSISTVIPLLQQNGMRIYPVIPEQFEAGEKSIRITDIQAPLIAKKQQNIQAGISIRNSLTNDTAGSLEVTVDGESIYTENIKIRGAEETRVLVPLQMLGEGIKEVITTFTPVEKTYPSSSARTFISGEKREKVLLISGGTEDGQYLAQTLTDQQFQLVQQQAGSLESETLKNLNDFSVLILNNIALNQLPSTFPAAVKQFVSSGGGFIMTGGNNSFGLGGYKDTSIADILPVHIVPPQKEKKRLNIAVQLILDKSGSMKDNSKILYSKMAAVQVVDSLKPDDYLGIIGFDSTPFELLPIAPVGINRDKAKKRVQLMFPGTTTKLLPALDLGRRRLELAKAGRKHMIILTDGKIPDGPARRPHYLQLVDEMRRTGITVSTFMIGSEQDFILREIAEVGGGAFYRTRNVSSLPRLFLDDIKVSTGERTQKEADRFDVRKGDGTISSTDLTAFPVIRGYVQTKPREDANLELVAYANRRAEPLLASWKFGKGTSIAYTSDASGRWSYYWVNWPRFHIFWNDLVETARGELDANSIQYDLKHYVKGDSLFIETSIYSSSIPGALQLKIETPDGQTSVHPLRALALGHYETRVDGIQAGTYTATLLAGDTVLTPVVLALSGELFGERKGQGYNIALLTRLAKETGGTVNPERGLLSAMQDKEIIRKPITQYLLLAAFILFLLEIYSREIGFRLFSIFPRRRTTRNRKRA